jgi:hypothetical protein
MSRQTLPLRAKGNLLALAAASYTPHSFARGSPIELQLAPPSSLLTPGRAAFWLLVLPLLGGCLEARPRATLEIEVRGSVYPRPRCVKGVASLGQVHPAGDPIPGAQVRLDPGELRGATDGEGRLVLELPEENYTLQLAAPGYAARQEAVPLRAGKTKRLTFNLLPCVSSGEDKLRVGFGKQVVLSAQSRCGGAWLDAAITWTQLEGPDIRDSVGSWSSPQLTFTTRSIEEVRSLPDEPQLLSFSHDEAGEYVFQLTARGPDGAIAKDYTLVTSTNVAGGVTSVPPFDVYTFAGEKQGPWQWQVVQWPAGWPLTLEGATTRTPSVRPYPPGPLTLQQTLTIRNARTGLTFSLSVGDWNQVNRDCGRADCHPPLQRGWESTRHSFTWRKLIDGELVSARGEPAESCATCHALGYDRSVTNGGYDDMADTTSARFPSILKAGNYDALGSAVKEVSNVYCLACHGPARVDPPVAEQPGRFAAGVCARCHDRKPEQDLVAQWRTSRMARTVKSDLNGPESREECTRCHTAQGSYYANFALGRPPSRDVLVMACCEVLAPITCQACHSPMYATNKAQVFRYGAVSTPSGLKLENVGSGALCAVCHNTEHDIAALRSRDERLAPHSPQADLSYGRAGFDLPAAGLPPLSGVACARTAGEGCVTCHMDKGPLPGEPGYRLVGDHTFRMTSSENVPNVRPCQACHPDRQSFNPRARADYDGDARVRGVREEFDGLMELLRARLAAAIVERGYTGCGPTPRRGRWFAVGYRQKIVVTDELGVDLGDCDGNGVVEREEQPHLFPADDVLLHMAAYNYLLVVKDGSFGLHNYPYVIKLLQRTVFALSGGKNLPAWELYR